jgi:hypothetical protein
MEYNGSGMVAMAGRNCVAIASDMRYGVQQTTIAENMPKVVWPFALRGSKLWFDLCRCSK